ncbi:MAG TPA: Tol-Pal system beta propeller repeat protein TolB [Thermodesulforhabdus norvegica]|uniref:Tol-Pal system beta propeller repeat protein TolB n=1 Tax=Thermodesulforhabdus norvegica TaxID=39841 RepID=A0A7C1AVU8_9BACT|nr:Tol-Pal system beta propeller repeat protein TolB [Deltaproteobacteria bacterium]MBW2068113.1 Tol-Pal system beta propeller repeat protein TolB [Deltaproteobacteria bacterium]HDL89918.1 Tol-Pal system beta propeller repeat protein TolB [Thermodesulforhabdus norvegica]
MRNLIKRCANILLMLLFLCITVGIVYARVYIDITNPSFRKLPVAVPDFKMGNNYHPEFAPSFAEIMRNDLGYSGAFDVLNPEGFLEDPQKMGVTLQEINFPSWKSIGAEFLVRGLYRTEGSKLHLELRFYDAVRGKLVTGRAYDGDIKDHRIMIHHFADEIMKALTGEPGSFSTKLAFVNKTGDIQTLYTVDFDGYGPLRVTPEEKMVVSPNWSPDGVFIAYVGYEHERVKLKLLDAQTSSVRSLPVQSSVFVAPRFHPVKPILAVTLARKNNPDIYLLDLDGRIVDTLVSGWSIEVPGSWSPDGKKLVYVSGETGEPQIYVYDTENRTRRRITFTGNYNTSPAWSPDGEWIAYSSRVEGYHQIFLTRPDGSEVYQLTFGQHNNEAPVWSPDGRMIAFQSDRGGKYEIWIMLRNGRNLRRLIKLPGEQKYPTWSPRL